MEVSVSTGFYGVLIGISDQGILQVAYKQDCNQKSQSKVPTSPFGKSFP